MQGQASSIPTEPIGSIPRPDYLVNALKLWWEGKMEAREFDAAASRALRDTIRRLEATGSPVITDGEQTKSSFVTYPLFGLHTVSPDGIEIPFEDGHTRHASSRHRTRIAGTSSGMKRLSTALHWIGPVAAMLTVLYAQELSKQLETLLKKD
jgi:hypothetical protein